MILMKMSRLRLPIHLHILLARIDMNKRVNLKLILRQKQAQQRLLTSRLSA